MAFEKRKLEDKELGDFLRNRKIVFCAHSVGINLYVYRDVFVYQYYMVKDVKELIVGTLEEAIDEAIIDLNKAKLWSDKKSLDRAIEKDLERLNELKAKKTYTILPDFDR